MLISGLLGKISVAGQGGWSRAVAAAFIHVLELRFRLRIPVAVKFAMAIGLMITIAMSVLGAVLIHNQTEILNRQIKATGRTVVAQMAKSTTEPLMAKDGLMLDVLASNLANAEDVLGTAIYSADRKLLSSAGNNPFEQEAPYFGRKSLFLDGSQKTLEWKWAEAPRGAIDAVTFISPVRFKEAVVGYVMISFSRAALNQTIIATARSIVTATTILILCGIAVAYWLGRRLYRPIYHLMDASRAISMGHYDYQIDTKRNDEIGDLIESLNTTARSLKMKSQHMAQGIRQQKQIANALTQHLPANVANEIITKQNSVTLGGSHVNASVMFIDIVGFTSASESMTPQQSAELLSDFYGAVAETAPLYKGTIDKFIGDAAMLIFGIADEDAKHTFHAIAYAVFFRRLMDKMNRLRQLQGKMPMRFRIGINTGSMLAGYIGSSERMQYTVVGDAVNVASRLCTVARADQIVITEDTYRLPDVANRLMVMEHQSIQVRGKSVPLNTYLVQDICQFYQAAMERQIQVVLRDLIKR